MELKKVLCLDLDGTVRRSKSGKTFIEGPDDVEIIPGMREIIMRYKTLGYTIVGITNQGGVAHGFKNMATVTDECHATESLLRKDMSEFVLSAVYICPYDEKGKIDQYNWRSLCRKPNYGMLVQLERDLVDNNQFPDWNNSLFVGDRPEDEECAKAAGIPFVWAHDFLKQQTNNETTSTSGTDAQ